MSARLWWLGGAVVGALVAVVVVIVTLVAPVGAQPAATPLPTSGPLPSPTGLYVDPDSHAARQQREWLAAGRVDDANLVARIAEQPTPSWLTEPTDAVDDEVRAYVKRAAAAGQRPLFVAYHIPGRDCGGFSGGGASDPGSYRAWIRSVAGALRNTPATVVLEPDALAHEVAGCERGQADTRYDLLADAVATLKATGSVAVYLDAGNPGFVTDIDALADALRRSGVEKADGFALNVANFYATDQVVDYGRRVSSALGGAHFVVDTSRNGRGRADGDRIDGGPAYCNPPGRGLGSPPTTATGDPVVDAYLWIKRPGDSDGDCRPGEPAAGQWWPDYALGLVRRAA